MLFTDDEGAAKGGDKGNIGEAEAANEAMGAGLEL